MDKILFPFIDEVGVKKYNSAGHLFCIGLTSILFLTLIHAPENIQAGLGTFFLLYASSILSGHIQFYRASKIKGGVYFVPYHYLVIGWTPFGIGFIVQYPLVGLYYLIKLAAISYYKTLIKILKL